MWTPVARESPGDINDAGQIVGSGDGRHGAPVRGWLWEDGGLTDLGNLPGCCDYQSYALGLSEAGQVVGRSQTLDYSIYHAFLWQAGTMADLNGLIPHDFGWVLATDGNPAAMAGVPLVAPRGNLIHPPRPVAADH